MLKLAGEAGDGVLLNYLPSSHVQPSIDQVRKGGPAKIFARLRVSHRVRERGAKSAKKDLFNYVMADGYAKMFKEVGFGEEVDETGGAQKQKNRDGAFDAVQK